jgi:putative thiamine transport system ATP-binding protein
MTGSGLVLRKITLAIDGHILLRDFDLAIAPGRIVTLMGPSGCGKSSLLAAITGVLEPAFRFAGDILIDDRAIGLLPPERRRVGILFQDDLLFPHLSVGDNLAFAIPPDRRGGARRLLVQDALADAQLAGLGDRDPASLSGGQRARVSLMRTLLSQPEALLLDEPFNKLDAALRQQFRAFVFERAGRLGIPTLLVTHDREDAPAGQPILVWPDPISGGIDVR